MYYNFYFLVALAKSEKFYETKANVTRFPTKFGCSYNNSEIYFLNLSITSLTGAEQKLVKT